MRNVQLLVLLLGLAGCGAPVAVQPSAPKAAETKPGLDVEGFLRAERIRGMGFKGREAVPTVTSALGDSNHLVRQAAIETLGRLGPAASSSVPELLPFLDNDAYRPLVIKSLAHMGPDAAPPVVAGLRHENPRIRSGAAESLGELGPSARAAAEPLVKVLADNDPGVRRAAATALGRIGQRDASIVVALERVLSDEDQEVRFRAAEALASLGTGQDPAIAVLVGNLKHENDEVRARAAAALGRMGTPGRSAGEALRAALVSDLHWPVRALAARSLARLEGPDAVPVLIEALRDPTQEVRNAVAEALGEIGPPAKDALPALRQAMLPLNGRETAYQAIRKIEGETDK